MEADSGCQGTLDRLRYGAGVSVSTGERAAGRASVTAGGVLAVQQEAARDPAAPTRPVVWWRELLLALVAYAVYAAGRSLHGQMLDADDVRIADAHGHQLLHLEQRWGVAWEHAVQVPFLAHHSFLKLMGGFYGGAHFVVTLGVLLWLLFTRPAHYRFWRTVLFTVTLASTAIFSLWPALPPRLMPVGERTVDTLDVIGGLWSYNHGVLEHISDPYAPMPSLHLAWASWVMLTLWTVLPARRRIVRVLLLAYPALVYFTVVVTGTHYVIDGVAGIAMLALSAGVVALYGRLRAERGRLRSERGGRALLRRSGEPQPVD